MYNPKGQIWKQVRGSQNVDAYASQSSVSHTVLLISVGCDMNPLHSYIRKGILHTILYTFPKVLTRRICATINSYLAAGNFLYSRDFNF